MTEDRAEPGSSPEPARGFDAASAAMALVTAVALVWAAWLRFGPAPPTEPPTVGALAPALRLLDPATSDPLVLLGLRDKVVWVTFWSAGPPTGRSDLADLEAVWTRFRAHPKFAMAALAVESDRPEWLRDAVSATKASLPTYLVSPETRRSFGAGPRHLPLHVLIDPTGRVVAVAQGRGPAVLARLADQAERWLDELGPSGKARFAARRDGDHGIFVGHSTGAFRAPSRAHGFGIGR